MSACIRRSRRPTIADSLVAGHFAGQRPSSSGLYRPALLANSGASPMPRPSRSLRAIPDITASIAQGPFWTVGVAYKDPASLSERLHGGSLTFQLFQNLTPNTVNMRDRRVHQRWILCGSPGTLFPRIVSNFDSPLTTPIQGAAPITRPAPAPAASPVRPLPTRTFKNWHSRASINWRSPMQAGRIQMIRNSSSTPKRGRHTRLQLHGLRPACRRSGHTDADCHSDSGPEKLRYRGGFAAGKPPDHHLDVAGLDEPRWRCIDRCHAGQAFRSETATITVTTAIEILTAMVRPHRSRSTSWLASTQDRQPHRQSAISISNRTQVRCRHRLLRTCRHPSSCLHRTRSLMPVSRCC